MNGPCLEYITACLANIPCPGKDGLIAHLYYHTFSHRKTSPMSGSSSSDSEMTAFWSTFPAEDRAAVDRLTKLTKASLDTVGEMIQFFEAR